MSEEAWRSDDPRLNACAILASDGTRFGYYERNYSKWLPPDLDSRILEVGCGSGSFIAYAKSLGYSQIEALEPDARFADFVRSQMQVNVVETDGIAYLSERPGQFDFIFCRQVICYFRPDQLSLWFQKLANSLAPDGRLVVEIFNAAHLTASWTLAKDQYIRCCVPEPLLRHLYVSNSLKIQYLGPEAPETKGLSWRKRIWLLSQTIWAHLLRLCFILERGLDPENPTVWTKNVICVGSAPIAD